MKECIEALAAEGVSFSSCWQYGSVARLLPFATTPVRDQCFGNYREQSQPSLPQNSIYAASADFSFGRKIHTLRFDMS